jgi:hypothetical protein
MTIPVGQLIAGRYEVLHSLGSAGQGDVYRVRDTYENAICVLKLLNVATLTAGTWDEAQILRDLADDHILEIRNADLYAGQPYIVTALAEHGTLETELAATGSLFGPPVKGLRSAQRQRKTVRSGESDASDAVTPASTTRGPATGARRSMPPSAPTQPARYADVVLAAGLPNDRPGQAGFNVSVVTGFFGVSRNGDQILAEYDLAA